MRDAEADDGLDLFHEAGADDGERIAEHHRAEAREELDRGHGGGCVATIAKVEASG